MTTATGVTRAEPQNATDADLDPESTAAATKAGAVLSAANKRAILDALDRLTAVMKSAGMGEEEAAKARSMIGAKCGMEAMPDDDWRPFGGAESFAEYDAYDLAQDRRRSIDTVTYTFGQIVDNIWADEDMTIDEKAAAVSRAAGELEQRIARIQTMTDDQLDVDLGVGGAVGASARRPLVNSLMHSLGLRPRAAKAVTKTEAGSDYSASAFADVADATKPSEWKLRLEESPGKVTVAQVARAITALGPSGFRGNKVDLGSSKDAVVSKISSAIGKTEGDAEQKQNLRDRLAKVKELGGEAVSPEAGSINVFFDTKSNSWRYVAVATNRYYDREGEVFPASAHKEYVDWVNRSKQFPELRLWHVPGSRLGQADGMAYDEDTGFRVSTGAFDKGMEEAARKLAGQKGNLMSHGYIYREDEFVDGVYRRYRDFEETVLPAAAAANNGTAFAPFHEEGKMIKQEQRTYLVDVLGEERVKQIETGLQTMAKDLTDANVGFKGLDFEFEKKDGAPAPGAPPADPAAPAPGAPPIAKAEDPAPPSATGGDPLEGVKALLVRTLEPLAAGMRDISQRVAALEKTPSAADAPAAADAGQKSLDDQLAELISPSAWREPGALKGASQDDATVIRTDKIGKKDRELTETIALAMKGLDSDDPEAEELDPALRAAAPLAGMVMRMAGSPAAISG